MYTSRKKIHKDKDAEPTEFEESAGQAIFDLETNSDLYINSAVQVDVAGNRKAVVIHIPYRLRKAYCKIHVRWKGCSSDCHKEDSEASKEGSAVQWPSLVL
ncbi:hypothetical protein Pyn_22945 [Prunus yedoensis var. nudiflora]|uniref:40S ribosomal protein S7 n=1 Tax=Prunus yedoensis var. nudiflora TaxID=2094558 RepID=A0A314YIZ8_PRUYE|nr:hypothetical protein Pyn_22945 [Prunus yedoensis var. nudiflora]